MFSLIVEDTISFIEALSSPPQHGWMATIRDDLNSMEYFYAPITGGPQAYLYTNDNKTHQAKLLLEMLFKVVKSV